MSFALLRAVRAERLKLRRSLTSWAILAGGLFVPAIMLAVRYHQRARTASMLESGTFWRQHWLESWESISILVLPLLLILVTTLVVQIEYRNNTWKQLHAAPLGIPTIYLAKLTVLLALLAAMFVVLNAGLFLAGILPTGTAAIDGLPVAELLRWNARFFVDCLPLLGLQYALALRFRNVLVPLGVGVAAWIVGLVVINTRHIVWVPYGYLGVDWLVQAGHRKAATLPLAMPGLAALAFAASVVAGFTLYALHRDRGATL